jgi:hypothetical protein
MTRTGQAAIDYARGRVGGTMPEGSGYCLKFVRDCFAVGSCYGSAIDAWNASPTQHPGDRNPPPAVPLYFLTPSVYDHVVFGVSTTEIISTFNADIRQFSGIADIERQFSGTYLGWTEDINRVTVWTSELVPPAALPVGGTEMVVVRGADTPQVYVTDGISRRYLDGPDEVADFLRILKQTDVEVIGQFTVDRIPISERC